MVTAEKAALGTNLTIVQTYGYAPGSDVPVYSKAYTTAGTLSIAGLPQMPGDAALLVRYATATRTSKNHPLYLFSWYHGLCSAAIGSPDTPSSTLVTANGTYASGWVTGISDGTITHKRAGPNGDVATGYLVENQVRHRDFP